MTTTIAPSKQRPFDPEKDREPLNELLKKYGKLHELIDVAHANGLALEELIERRYNALVGVQPGPI